MPVIRSNRPRALIFPDDIIEFGWEKAYVLANIGQCIEGDGYRTPIGELYSFRCFNKVFTETEFNKILNDLISEGISVFPEQHCGGGEKWKNLLM